MSSPDFSQFSLCSWGCEITHQAACPRNTRNYAKIKRESLMGIPRQTWRLLNEESPSTWLRTGPSTPLIGQESKKLTVRPTSSPHPWYCGAIRGLLSLFIPLRSLCFSRRAGIQIFSAWKNLLVWLHVREPQGPEPVAGRLRCAKQSVVSESSILHPQEFIFLCLLRFFACLGVVPTCRDTAERRQVAKSSANENTNHRRRRLYRLQLCPLAPRARTRCRDYEPRRSHLRRA